MGQNVCISHGVNTNCQTCAEDMKKNKCSFMTKGKDGSIVYESLLQTREAKANTPSPAPPNVITCSTKDVGECSRIANSIGQNYDCCPYGNQNVCISHGVNTNCQTCAEDMKKNKCSFMTKGK